MTDTSYAVATSSNVGSS